MLFLINDNLVDDQQILLGAMLLAKGGHFGLKELMDMLIVHVAFLDSVVSSAGWHSDWAAASFSGIFYRI